MITKKDPSMITSYFEDSSNLKGGSASVVVIPESYDEVSLILRDSDSKKMPVTFTGAGTGNTGGRIPFGGIVVSLEKLNNIVSVEKNVDGGSIKAGAGVLIKDIKLESEKAGLFYSYDPTEQTAFVGGTVATNASGARSFKYGPTRASVQGLKIALADGFVLELKRGAIRADKRKMRFEAGGRKFDIDLPTYFMPKTKNSAGYFAEDHMDLVDLFIGQEGTLGCIIETDIKLNRKPENIISMYTFFNTEDDALSFAAEARNISLINRRKADEINAMAIEYFDTNSLMLLHEKYGDIPRTAGACIFFEQESSSALENKILDKWAGLIQRHNGDADNSWIALNDLERAKLLDKRHYMGEAMGALSKKHNMPKVTTDIAVPNRAFREMQSVYKKYLDESGMEYFLFGHVGDSHIHMNLIPKCPEDLARAKAIAIEFVKKGVMLGGTVSAEHGIGKLRREYLKILYGEKGISEMINVKKSLDPNLILGRGNIFEIGK